MKLRPYHNPENVDESCVPDGWRFLYADEAGKDQNKPCLAWSGFFFDSFPNHFGQFYDWTYIIPVNT